MDRPTCKTCPYWCFEDLEDGEDRGFCKRFPPLLATSSEGMFPIMERDDWCGEHPDFPAYIANLKKPDLPKGADPTCLESHSPGELYSVNDTARIFRRREETIRGWAMRGNVPSFRDPDGNLWFNVVAVGEARSNKKRPGSFAILPLANSSAI